MADIDLNLYLHSEKFTSALKEAGVDVDKFYADWKLSEQEQIASQQKLIASTEALRKKNEELQKQMNTGKGKYGDLLKEMSKNKDQILQNEIALDQMSKAEKTVGVETGKTTEQVKKSEKATKSFSSTARTATLVLLAMAAAGRILTGILNSAKESSDRLARGWAALKFSGEALLKTISTGDWKNLFKNMKDGVITGRQFSINQEIITAKTLQTNNTIDELSNKVSNYRKLLEDVNITEADKIKYQKLIYEGEKEIAEARKKLASDQLTAALSTIKLSKDELENMIALGPAYEENALKLQVYNKEKEKNPDLKAPKNIMDLAEGYKKYAKVQGDAFNQAAAALSKYNQAIAAENGVIDETDKDAKEKLIERQKKFNEIIAELYDEYNKSGIKDLKGVEKIEAQRDYYITAINLQETELKKLGTLSEENIKLLEALRQQYYNNAEIEIADYQRKELNKQIKQNEKKIREEKRYAQEYAEFWNAEYDRIIGDQLDRNDLESELELQGLEITGKLTEKERLRIDKENLEKRLVLYKRFNGIFTAEDIKQIENSIALIDKEVKSLGFNFWEAIGITDKKQQNLIKENAQIIINTALSTLDTIYAKKVEDAERNRQLIDDQIGYTQDALNQEIELAKLGYANNVDAKRKELEELKKASEKAIAEEEKAKKKQRAFDLIVLAADSLSGIAKVITNTMVANAIALTSPLTAPVHIALNNAMMGLAIASIIASVAAASATKLAEGAVGTETGIIAGKSHQQGGERFLDHVEVERGEMWGVLSKSAAAKHGREFAQIVTSFNKDNLIIERQDAPTNNILVDVNQTNSRLDKVEYQLIKLNRHFGNRKEVHETSDVRIEKIGNKTRIIRK